MTTPQSVGVIGVGNIGEHFVEWLTDAGYDVVAFDINPERMSVATGKSAIAGENPADVTNQSDIIILSLPGTQYVETVMEGDDGIFDVLTAGQLVIDTGTTEIDTEVHYEAVCEDRGAGYIESPLTWGGPGDKPTMFVGGDEEWYEHGRPIIEELSYSHHRFGGIGKGQVMKAGHRLRQNNMAAVNAEMVEFLRNNGVDPKAADELMEFGLHGRFFEETYPSTDGWERAMAEHDVSVADSSANSYGITESAARPRMRQSHWAKDQAYAISIGHSSNTALPISSAVFQAMLMSQNYAEALFDRDIGFQEPDWFDRADPITHYRRLNRPAEEWRRLRDNSEE